jgi:hypothetical protein
MMNKLIAVIFSLVCAAAYAGTGTLNYSPSGASQIRMTTDGSGFYLNNVTIWDSVSGAYGLGINSSGQQTIANTSFAATQSGAWSMLPYTANTNYVRGAASATGTSATTLLPAATSLKNYVVAIQCYRSDTPGSPSTITITFNDSASTVIVLPNTGGGGGSNVPLTIPLVTATDTAFTFTSGTNTTTVYCNAQGYTGS